MTNFYQDLITQKSLRVLENLRKSYDFVLIGGWAVWLYTQALKSKDIDLIVEFNTLGNLKKDYQIIKNQRLKKYEARVEEVDIDVYLPYYSNPGLPAEFILKHTLSHQGYRVPKPEILLILKQFVYEQRKASIKGKKDKLDVLSLLDTIDLDFEFYKQILKKTKKENLLEKLKNLLKGTTRATELNLTNHKMAKLKRKVVEKIS